MGYDNWLERVHKERDLENQKKMIDEMKRQNRLLEEQNRAARPSSNESGRSSSEGNWILGWLIIIGIVWYCIAHFSIKAGLIALGIIAGLIAIISFPALAIMAISLVAGTVVAFVLHFNDLLTILTWVVSVVFAIWVITLK